jgi:hypothetical protein
MIQTLLFEENRNHMYSLLMQTGGVTGSLCTELNEGLARVMRRLFCFFFKRFKALPEALPTDLSEALPEALPDGFNIY